MWYHENAISCENDKDVDLHRHRSSWWPSLERAIRQEIGMPDAQEAASHGGPAFVPYAQVIGILYCARNGVAHAASRNILG